MKFKPLILSAVLAALALPAVAQQQSPHVDQRLAAPMIQAQSAEIALRDAAIKALQEDAEKREADLSAWFKAWFAK